MPTLDRALQDFEQRLRVSRRNDLYSCNSIETAGVGNDNWNAGSDGLQQPARLVFQPGRQHDDGRIFQQGTIGGRRADSVPETVAFQHGAAEDHGQIKLLRDGPQLVGALAAERTGGESQAVPAS